MSKCKRCNEKEAKFCTSCLAECMEDAETMTTDTVAKHWMEKAAEKEIMFQEAKEELLKCKDTMLESQKAMKLAAAAQEIKDKEIAHLRAALFCEDCKETGRELSPYGKVVGRHPCPTCGPIREALRKEANPDDPA